MADEPLPAPVVDIRKELAALKAVQAPLLFFEAATTYGVRNGVVNVTLEAGMHTMFDDKTAAESRVVAHIRFPVATISNLRNVLDQVELLLQPPASEERN